MKEKRAKYIHTLQYAGPCTEHDETKIYNPYRPPPVLSRNSLRDSIGRMLRPN